MEQYIWIALGVLGVLMLVQLLLTAYLARLVADFLNRFRLSKKEVESKVLETGSRAPLFREKDQHGNLVRMADYQGAHTLVVFASPTCGSCQEILPNLPEVKRKRKDLRIIVATGSTAKWQFELPDGVSFVSSESILENYLVTKLPSMAVVDMNGIVLTVDQIFSLEHLISILDYHLGSSNEMPRNRAI